MTRCVFWLARASRAPCADVAISMQSFIRYMAVHEAPSGNMNAHFV
jgi:hypothetical protein